MSDDPKRDPEQFWHKVMEHFFTDEASELDYSDFLEMGEECGLLTIEEFDPKNKDHESVTHGDELEPGDTIYVPVPKPD